MEPVPPSSDLTRIGHWRSTLLVSAVVLGAYLLLLNPFWTPGGDSELFIAAARSIVRGEGYTYNGRIVRIAPPAWPYVMAAAMAVSPTFLMLKILTVLLMTAAWTMAHRVMLRLGPPAWATWAAILGAILVPVYSLTFWLHSEPLFCALAWAATLMAVRVAEDRRRTADLLGVILLCGAMAAVRWTSGLQWGIVAAVLASGWTWRGRLLLSRPGEARVSWGLGLSGLVTVLVFLLLFFGLPALVSAATTAPVPQLPVTTQDAEDATPQLVDNTIFQDLSPWEERGVRLLAAGHWPAWTLWYPTRFAGGFGLGERAPPESSAQGQGWSLSWIPLLLGWFVIGLLVLTAWQSLRPGPWSTGEAVAGGAGDWPRGRFLWPALVVYIFLLVFVWPLPNARYLVPVAPLLVLGVLRGCAILGTLLGRPRLGTWLRGLFLASLLLANGGMFAIDAFIQRSGDRLLGGSARQYYARYEAGLHTSLLRSLHYLRERNVEDGELAVSERYFNLNRMRFSKGGPRNVVMLLDREVVSPSEFYSFVPGEIPRKLFREGRVYPGGFREWAQRNGVKYYLYQQPSEPWRLWHFRVPAELQGTLTGTPLEEPSFGWLLFSAENGFSEPVALPESIQAPTRIPGL